MKGPLLAKALFVRFDTDSLLHREQAASICCQPATGTSANRPNAVDSWHLGRFHINSVILCHPLERRNDVALLIVSDYDSKYDSTWWSHWYWPTWKGGGQKIFSKYKKMLFWGGYNLSLGFNNRNTKEFLCSLWLVHQEHHYGDGAVFSLWECQQEIDWVGVCTALYKQTLMNDWCNDISGISGGFEPRTLWPCLVFVWDKRHYKIFPCSLQVPLTNLQDWCFIPAVYRLWLIMMAQPRTSCRTVLLFSMSSRRDPEIFLDKHAETHLLLGCCCCSLPFSLQMFCPSGSNVWKFTTAIVKFTRLVESIWLSVYQFSLPHLYMVGRMY